MKYLKKEVPEKATLCNKNICVTVYGETAKTINAIISIIILMAAISFVAMISK